MSGLQCAKVIIDNYGALGGAATGMATSAEASCEALMQLVEADPSLWPKVKAISDRACYWAAEIEKWKKKLNAEVRELAEQALKGESGNSKAGDPSAAATDPMPRGEGL